MKKIITINDKKEWCLYVKRALNYDFYHTWYYHSLDTSGFPILFVYHEDENFIAFPLLKRSIPESDLFDFTSVYGYTGPISNINFELLEDGFAGPGRGRDPGRGSATPPGLRHDTTQSGARAGAPSGRLQEL